MAQLVTTCVQEDADRRPSFLQIIEFLLSIQEKLPEEDDEVPYDRTTSEVKEIDPDPVSKEVFVSIFT